ncbi:MAG: fibronectin type III domain-containing protein [Eubacterium sp.]
MILKKKLAVLGLAAVMTVAFMPAMAFANETGNTATTTNSTQTATTKTLPNDSLLKDGTYQLTSGTYTLSSDLTHGISIAQGQEVTLDLNGKNITVSSGDAIVNGGTLTINGSGSVTAPRAAIGNTPTGVCTVNGGSYSSSTWYAIRNMGTMTINNATATTTGASNPSSVVENGWYGNEANDTIGGTHYAEASTSSASLTIKGGNYTATSTNKSVVKNDDYGNLTIDDGTFNASTYAGVLNWNTATINGGHFNGPNTIVNGRLKDAAGDQGSLTINGGTYESSSGSVMGYNPDADAEASTTITGGTFKDSVQKTDIVYTDNKGTQHNDGNAFTLSISGGSFVNDVTSYTNDNAPVATVTNGSTTTYAVGQDAIAKAAEDSSNTVTITKGNVSLTGANAKIENAASNTKGTVTVDGQTVAAGKSVAPSAATTIANLKNEIASLQNQLAQAQAAAAQSSTKASASDQQITQLKKDLADAQAQLKAAQAKADEQNSTLTAPAQVTNLKAKAGKRYVKLSWTALQSNATGYRVYRKVKGGKYTRIKTLTKADASSWTNKGLKKGKTYYYRVRAYKSINSGELWGAYSNTAKAKVK